MPTSVIERLRKVEGHLTFYRLHVLVGLFIPLIAGAVLYASNTNYIAYVDALFMCVSALTTTGLTSVYVSNMNRWQQVILYLLFTFGSIPSVSLITLLVRRHKFRRYLRHAPRKYQNGPEDDNEVNADQSSQDDLQEDGFQSQPKDIDKDRHSPTPAPRYNYYRGGFPNPIVSLYHTASSKLRSRRQPSKQGSGGRNKHQYLSFDHRSRTSRNSDFRALSNQERVEVGQLELQAMSLLAIVMITYMIIAQLLAVIIWAPYFSAGHYTDPDFDNGFETSRTWFAFFQASSMFNNCGLSLVDSSLTNFQSAYVMLVPAIFLMYGGYFGFPLVLRGILWALSRFVPANSRIASPLFFLRDHPRRVTYITFPTYETWVFTFVILVLTMADWILYEVLDIGEWSVYVYMTAGQRAVNGLVQSVAVRSSGFYTTTLSTEAPALHISYLFMMVFGVYPFAMAIRASNVYEERHLGLIDDSERSEGSGVQHVKRECGYVGEHMRQQLAYDVWWLVLCTWIICIAERGKLTDTGRLSWFTVFAIIFEVASAYANVGFSLGVPYSSASFATSLGTLSKLVLMAAMIRGRTRELPIGVDRAILTPEQLKQHRDPPEHEEGDSGETAGQEAGQSS